VGQLRRIGSARLNPNASVAIARLAGRQWGVVALWQLLEAGIGKATVSRWVASGRLVRIYPGVYALGHTRLRDEGWLAAALLYAGKGSALSHRTAGWWLQIIDCRPTRIDVSAPTRRSSLQALSLHHPRTLERTFHRGLPVTPPARTLLDLAPTLPRRQLRKALAETFFRRLASRSEIEAALGKGRAGSRALRAALKSHLPQFSHSRTDMEDAFLELCERFGLPLPELNERIEGFTVDAVWHTQRVAVELDSELGHGVEGTVHRDRARDLALRRAGWTVLRYSWQQVLREPEAVARDLEAALQAQIHGRRPAVAVEARRE
jgi:hypothetical protein